jgi:hypothetical protein
LFVEYLNMELTHGHGLVNHGMPEMGTSVPRGGTDLGSSSGDHDIAATEILVRPPIVGMPTPCRSAA